MKVFETSKIFQDKLSHDSLYKRVASNSLIKLIRGFRVLFPFLLKTISYTMYSEILVVISRVINSYEQNLWTELSIFERIARNVIRDNQLATKLTYIY